MRRGERSEEVELVVIGGRRWAEEQCEGVSVGVGSAGWVSWLGVVDFLQQLNSIE